jgi:hypothetical protein
MHPLRRRSDSLPKRDPIRDAIANRAYELFLARGCAHGRDAEDWLAAEQELMDRRQVTRRAAAAPIDETYQGGVMKRNSFK